MTIWRLWFKAALVAGMFLYGVITVSTIMPVSNCLLGRRASIFNEAIRRNWNRTVCRILNVRLTVSGEPSRNARLWVANHISWLDIIALGSQETMTFVAKHEVANWPVMGYLARRIGTLFVRRGDPEQSAAVAEQMTWQLRRGKRLMLFPEGTTTNGEKVLRFHSKLFQPAHLAQVQVQAIALTYRGTTREIAPFIGDDEFLPHLLRLLRHRCIDIHLHYCPPLPANVHRDVLAQTTRRQIAEAITPETAKDYRRA